ncbi:MAG: fatty acid--CoA ligase family protein [Methylacidiphilales bacterium]|nr:fatty acid--CoA ligase family protein [Candidatus Methylacidiphilales bacterium]
MLWQCWLKTVSRMREKPALIHAPDGEILSFAQLHENAELLAERLRSARGTCMAFALPNSFHWIELFLAAQKSGVTALALDASTPGRTHAGLAGKLGASFLWKQDRLTRLKTARTKTHAAYYKLTSGSTGLPKVIPCSATNLEADATQVVRTMKIRPADRNLGLIPFGHSYGLGNLVLPLIVQGTPIVLAESYLPGQIPDWIHKHQITVFPSVPAVFRILSQLPGKHSLPPLRSAISAGAPLSPETAKAFQHRFKLKLHNFYGSSETGGICYDSFGSASLTGRSVGKPLAGVKIKILKNGQLQISSRAVATPSHKFTVQDLGKWNRRGEIVLSGRLQKAANIGGKKIQPGEIESILRSMPGVRDAWATVLHSGGRDYLAAAAETTKSKRAIHALLVRQLPAWKLPKRLAVLPAFPRNARGKIDATQLLKITFPAAD